MRIKPFVVFLVLFVSCVLVFSARVVAQNEEVGGSEDVALIGLGTVARVEAGLVTLMEYNYETDMDREVHYTVNEKTQFENIKALSDLKAGDSAEIVYVEAEGQKVALVVSKEEDYIEDDEAGETENLQENVEALPTAGEVRVEETVNAVVVNGM